LRGAVSWLGLADFARESHSWVFAAEQASFAAAGVGSGSPPLAAIVNSGARAGAGIAALLLTSMHMTLLGALLALAGRPLFAHPMSHAGFGRASELYLTLVADQQVGGVIMLRIGGASYMAGALFLTLAALQSGGLHLCLAAGLRRRQPVQRNDAHDRDQPQRRCDAQGCQPAVTVTFSRRCRFV
jgi:hypothetical protein